MAAHRTKGHCASGQLSLTRILAFRWPNWVPGEAPGHPEPPARTAPSLTLPKSGPFAVRPVHPGPDKSWEHGPAFELGGKERRVPCQAADQRKSWPGWNKPTLGRWFRRAGCASDGPGASVTTSMLKRRSFLMISRSWLAYSWMIRRASSERDRLGGGCQARGGARQRRHCHPIWCPGPRPTMVCQRSHRSRGELLSRRYPEQFGRLGVLTRRREEGLPTNQLVLVGNSFASILSWKIPIANSI